MIIREIADACVRINGDLAAGHGRLMQEARQDAERYRLAWLSARRRAARASDAIGPEAEKRVHRICVDVPADLDDAALEDLFTAIADAAYAWEPADRDGWDVDVSGSIVTVEDSGPPSVDDLIGVLGPDWTGGLFHPEIRERK